MLDIEEVRSLILCRIIAATDSCNSYHINHCEGQIRALLAVLTGGPPPRVRHVPISEILDVAGIPHGPVDGDWVKYDEAWLIAHGFEADGDDVRHPRFSKGW